MSASKTEQMNGQINLTPEQLVCFQRLQMIRYQNAMLANLQAQKKSVAMNEKANLNTQATATHNSDLKYKTELCKTFSQKGYCGYGTKCRFAHGKTELCDKLVDQKKYKQKECASFFTNMTCCYGSRCHFKHEERKLAEIPRAYNHYLLQNLKAIFASNDFESLNTNEIIQTITQKAKISNVPVGMGLEDKFAFLRKVSVDSHNHSDCNTSISSDDVNNTSVMSSKQTSRFAFAQCN